MSLINGARPGTCYILRGALYLALTDRCNARPLMDLRGPSFAMPSSSGFVPLGRAQEPSAEELVRAVDAFYESLPAIGSSGESDPGVVFGGRGEPLLRRETVSEAIREIKRKRHGAKLRVTTNGLFDPSVADELREAGLRSVSVYLASANPEEYARLMAPTDGRTLGDALAFIEKCASNGMEVEATCTRAPGVDVNAVRDLAMAVGAVKFRDREYFS